MINFLAGIVPDITHYSQLWTSISPLSLCFIGRKMYASSTMIINYHRLSSMAFDILLCAKYHVSKFDQRECTLQELDLPDAVLKIKGTKLDPPDSIWYDQGSYILINLLSKLILAQCLGHPQYLVKICISPVPRLLRPFARSGFLPCNPPPPNPNAGAFLECDLTLALILELGYIDFAGLPKSHLRNSPSKLNFPDLLSWKKGFLEYSSIN
jgi:hypothetical protein